MPAIEVGRICTIIAGRRAGRKCVIVDIIDDKFVVVTGPKDLTGVKRRRMNIKHLEPMDKKIEIEKGADDSKVMEAIRQAGLEEYMKEVVRPEIPIPMKLASYL